MSSNGLAPPSIRRSRFADGSQVRLPLSDGDWVSVRAELTYGQERRLVGAGLHASAGVGEPTTLDLASYDLERLHAWLLAWSFKDEDGDQIPVTRERIEALHPDTAAEINAALDRHIEAQAAKKAGSSPAPTDAPGPSKSPATSPSAAPSAGVGSS